MPFSMVVSGLRLTAPNFERKPPSRKPGTAVLLISVDQEIGLVLVPAFGPVSATPQNAQRVAAVGITLRHSGHCLVSGSKVPLPSSSRACILFIGMTTRK